MKINTVTNTREFPSFAMKYKSAHGVEEVLEWAKRKGAKEVWIYHSRTNTLGAIRVAERET